MGKSIDPFEEYLRKKKAELLQQKLRVEPEPPPPPVSPEVPSNDDPAVAQKLREEAEDFFEEGGQGAAALFSDVGEDLSDDKVDEIKDAIEEVFEEAPPKPKKESGKSFVQFFQEVESKYEGPGSIAGAEIAVEVEGLGEAEVASEVALPNEVPEISSEDETATIPEGTAGRLSLAEILGRPPANDAERAKRLELLCRLVTRLVERAGIPESDILEALIKSGIEF